MFARSLIEILVAFFIVTEVVIPLFRRVPLFPLFRNRKEAKLHHQIEQVEQELTEAELEEKLRRLRVEQAGRGDALLKAYDAENAHLMERDLI